MEVSAVFGPGCPFCVLQQVLEDTQGSTKYPVSLIYAWHFIGKVEAIHAGNEVGLRLHACSDVVSKSNTIQKEHTIQRKSSIQACLAFST